MGRKGGGEACSTPRVVLVNTVGRDLSLVQAERESRLSEDCRHVRRHRLPPLRRKGNATSGYMTFRMDSYNVWLLLIQKFQRCYRRRGDGNIFLSLGSAFLHDLLHRLGEYFNSLGHLVRRNIQRRDEPNNLIDGGREDQHAPLQTAFRDPTG